MKKALIVGHTGQDGSYLVELLNYLGYAVLGISSTKIYSNFPSDFQNIDISIQSAVENLMLAYDPDEVYYLAAFHNSSSDQVGPDYYKISEHFRINTLIPGIFLSIIATGKSRARFFFPGSSHIFGYQADEILDEKTQYHPECLYGISKVAGINLCHHYREQYGVYASVGIFFNHESPRRQSKFVSKKIVETAVDISKGKANTLWLGNPDAMVDWGYAPDYIRAAHALLQVTAPETCLVCTGELHSVGEFAERTFTFLGLDASRHISIDPGLITKQQRNPLQGNNIRIRQLTGWQPTTNFEDLIRIMVEEELKKYDS